jgi:hypothetical protein
VWFIFLTRIHYYAIFCILRARRAELSKFGREIVATIYCKLYIIASCVKCTVHESPFSATSRFRISEENLQKCLRNRQPIAMSRSGRSKSSSKAWKWPAGKLCNRHGRDFCARFAFSLSSACEFYVNLSWKILKVMTAKWENSIWEYCKMRAWAKIHTQIPLQRCVEEKLIQLFCESKRNGGIAWNKAADIFMSQFPFHTILATFELFGQNGGLTESFLFIRSSQCNDVTTYVQ